jgi:hypothetical protein
MTNNPETWESARYNFALRLLESDPVYVGEWQSQKSVAGANTTYEVLNASFSMQMPHHSMDAARVTGANLPWAEDHFQERVSGIPMNPPPSNAWWPFAVAGNDMHKANEQFSHTYPERYWPKQAGDPMFHPRAKTDFPMWGIRYPYGDLGDVVRQLYDSPYTRQAYLPVWLPEDTGSVQGQRVPCTLGYQFLIRRDAKGGNELHVIYSMRSCDFMRHLADDIYMTIRLAQWVRTKLVDQAVEDDYVTLQDLTMGKLHFHAGSLHIFEPDRLALKRIANDMTAEYNQRLTAYASGNGSDVA